MNIPWWNLDKTRFKHEKWELIQWAWRFREFFFGLYHQIMMFYSSKTGGPGRSKRLKLLAFVNNGGYRNVWKLNNGHSTILYHLVLGVPYVQTDPIGEVWWFTTGEWTFKFHRIGHVSTTLRRFQELCFILFPEEILIYVKLIVSIFYYIPIHIYI